MRVPWRTLMREKHILQACRTLVRAAFTLLTPAVISLALAIGTSPRCAAAPVPKARGEEKTPEAPPIGGLVEDAERKPVGDVSIDVYSSYRLRKEKDPLKADEGGGFRVPGRWADPGENYCLVVRDPGRIGWCDVFQQMVPRKAERQLRIRLLPLTKTVKGTLVDPAGKPLAGVPVHIASLLHETNRWAMIPEGLLPGGKTDENGAFAVKLPAASGAWLWPGDPWRIAKRIEVTPESNDVGRVELPEAGQISGRVLDAAGKPVKGAEVSVQAHRHEIFLAGPYYAVTDADGRYRISGQPPGSYNVLFSPPESDIKLTAAAKDGAQVEAKKETVVDLKAIDGRLLTGKVIDDATGEPIPSCHVGYYGAARPRSGAACMMVRTDAKGAFHFYVPPGKSYAYIAEGRYQRIAGSEQEFEVAEKGEIEPIILRRGPEAVRKDIQILPAPPKGN
jgi:Carboxypeptidase regulatory-like domain